MRYHQLAPEERSPCGTPGAAWAYSRTNPKPDLSDVLVWSDPARPWVLLLWEPLLTKAPSPNLAMPYCCYANTVIFYVSPFIARPARPYRGRDGILHRQSGSVYLEWDKIDTRLCWNDLVRFNGVIFEVAGGRVVWARRRWWMIHAARRDEARTLADAATPSEAAI